VAEASLPMGERAKKRKHGSKEVAKNHEKKGTRVKEGATMAYDIMVSSRPTEWFWAIDSSHPNKTKCINGSGNQTGSALK